MQVTTDNAARLRGCDMVGGDGKKVGEIVEIYLDDVSGEPEWAAVNTGLLGTRTSFVPLKEADVSDGDDPTVTVPYDQGTVKDAPDYDQDAHLAPEEKRALYQHYSLEP
jgi:PRC-barrel domain